MQDYNARQIIAYTLSQGLGQDIAADDVIAVSAMEAVGVAAAMERFQAIPGNPKVLPLTLCWIHHLTFFRDFGLYDPTRLARLLQRP